MSVAALTASLLILCPASAHAQGGVPLWTNRYDGSLVFGQRALALDSSGNVFVGGTAEGHYLTVAYSSTGVLLWTNRYDGPFNVDDGVRAIAVDSSNNVFVTGRYFKGIGQTDYLTLKYSNAGDLLWSNGAPDDQGGLADAIVVDSNGNVFVAGQSGWSESGDYVTLKYSNEGDLMWLNLYDGPASNYDWAHAIALDSRGDVFVTGESFGASGNLDYATIKYSSAGEMLWESRYNGPANGHDHANAIAVDSGGNLFVTGGSGSRAVFPQRTYYATIKYSNDGVPLWTNRYHGPATSVDLDDFATAIATDTNGNVFVTGSTLDHSTVTYFDSATIKYSGAGVPLWTNRYDKGAPPAGFNGVDWGGAWAIAVDGGGNVFVTGGATIAYSNSGVPLWTNRYDGSFYGYAIAVDNSGNVLVTGVSYDPITGSSEIVTIKYSSSIPLPRLDFQKLNNGLVLNWTNAGFNLQTAPAVTGPFTNILGATSPYTNVTTGAQQFFRLKGD